MERKLFDDVTELLKIHGLTYKWLMERLNENGCDVNKVSFSKWVHGEQLTAKAQNAHAMALRIIDLYCKSFAEKVREL